MREKIKLALIHGESYAWIGKNVMNNVTKQRVYQKIQDYGLKDVRKVSRKGKLLTNHISLKAEGLRICSKCHEFYDLKPENWRGYYCRKCDNARIHDYYAHNPEAKTKQKAWNQANRDKCREYSRKWGANNRERRREYRQSYQKTEQYRQWYAKWYEEVGRTKAKTRRLNRKLSEFTENSLTTAPDAVNLSTDEPLERS